MASNDASTCTIVKPLSALPLSGKFVIVTGSTSGIGLGIAQGAGSDRL
jgi:hypothetical protein